MAKKALAALVMSMAEISKLTQSDTVSLFVEKTTTVSRAFMDSAKLIIHLRTTLSKTQTIHGLLGKKGIATSTINNAMQAVRVWDDLVVRKFVTEAQFDKLSYSRFVGINAAIIAKGKEGPEIVGKLVAAGKIDEVEAITAESKAAKKAKTAPATTPAVVTATTEPAKTEETPAPAKPEEKVSNIVEVPRQKATLADGEALLDSLQNVFAELAPADFIVLSGKLVTLADTIVEQEATIRKQAKKAA